MLNHFICGFCTIVLCACDLRPKIASIPDNIGMFIENRYPALLADPVSQPEIYNSAVTDYGVYASPELYGSANIDDYVLYASVDDYVLVPQDEESTDAGQEDQTETKAEETVYDDYLIVPVYGGNTVVDEKPIEEMQAKEVVQEVKDDGVIIVAKGDTVYSLARKNNMTVDEFARINNIREPYTLSIGQKLTTRAPEVKGSAPVKEIPNVISVEKVQQIEQEKIAVAKPEIKPTGETRVDLQEIVVVKGDTLYSLSRKYEIPVNDLAVLNKISAPFTLSIGQKLKVPTLDKVQTVAVNRIATQPKIKEAKITPAKTVKQITKQQTQKQQPVKKETKQVSSKTVNTAKPVVSKAQSVKVKQQSQKIIARSNSKFSWPVRGPILSGFGLKNSGLVNDGINIFASFGTPVKAAENGVVAYAGNEVKGMGNLIIIQHSDGWMTVYAHLDSMNVKRGTKVSVGQQIGKVGKTGKVDKPQLHFEIRKGTKPYNPIQYLKK